jgi:hypothetical protein
VHKHAIREESASAVHCDIEDVMRLGQSFDGNDVRRERVVRMRESKTARCSVSF